MTLLIESAAIRWYGDRLALLDQRRLPASSEWLECTDAAQTAAAIQNMVVRGAPAIGICAAYGIALEARRLGADASRQHLDEAFRVLGESRPTAVNLFWALERMAGLCKHFSGQALADALATEALLIHREDQAMNQTLAEHGAPLLPEGCQVYTHCNTGALATGGHGTALGIIRSAWSQGRIRGVIAGETRPWLQGARLTSWELMQDNIPVTLVVDSAAGHLMAKGEIGAVVVGADRITANGDTANKIGTYALAVLARHHGIAFIVAAPSSTVDLSLTSGSAVAIEERPAAEVRGLNGQNVAPADVAVRNPAFDITPAALISAIVTERGVIHAPDSDKLAEHMQQPATPRPETKGSSNHG